MANHALDEKLSLKFQFTNLWLEDTMIIMSAVLHNRGQFITAIKLSLYSQVELTPTGMH